MIDVKSADGFGFMNLMMGCVEKCKIMNYAKLAGYFKMIRSSDAERAEIFEG